MDLQERIEGLEVLAYYLSDIDSFLSESLSLDLDKCRTKLYDKVVKEVKDLKRINKKTNNEGL